MSIFETLNFDFNRNSEFYENFDFSDNQKSRVWLKKYWIRFRKKLTFCACMYIRSSLYIKYFLPRSCCVLKSVWSNCICKFGLNRFRFRHHREHISPLFLLVEFRLALYIWYTIFHITIWKQRVKDILQFNHAFLNL